MATVLSLLASERHSVWMAHRTGNHVGSLSIWDGLPKYVGQLVVPSDDVVLAKKLSYSATGFEHLHIQDIIAQQQPTARNCVQDLFAKTTKQCPEPEGTGITFEQGVVYETLVCGIVNYTFDAAKVAEYCLQLKTDRIGVVVDLCRSVGGFKKDFGANREPLVGDSGAVVSVGIVFLQARNGVVHIADPPITCACCML